LPSAAARESPRFSKINAGQLTLNPAPYRLPEAVEDVAMLVSTRVAEKNLEMIVRVDPRLPEFLVGDVSRFRQTIATCSAMRWLGETTLPEEELANTA
jgi:hypothetical protein